MALSLVCAPLLAEAQSGTCSLQLSVDRLTTPSSTCIACHDSMQGAFEHGGHRVEVTYEPYGRPGMRAKPEEQQVNVVLPGGRITCLSCHDPRSTLPNRLAATTAGPVAQRLCVACHLFD